MNPVAHGLTVWLTGLSGSGKSTLSSAIHQLLTRHGVITLVSAISPYRDARDAVRARIPNFIEVYVNAPLATCEGRDVKGLYRKARAGQIKHFTGIDDPYDPPLHPEVECHTDRESVAESVAKISSAIDHRLANSVLL